jgi:DNA mismatch endonuclease (patch repair protein)
VLGVGYNVAFDLRGNATLVQAGDMHFLNVSEATRKSMRANKGKNTRPEMIVRRLVHGMGYRYRLHRKDLPGTPDLVFGPAKKVIFVHGCFWHQHDATSCRGARIPKLREEYWRPKLLANKKRDERSRAALKSLGWRSLVLWECQLKDWNRISKKVQSFLGYPSPQAGRQ